MRVSTWAVARSVAMSHGKICYIEIPANVAEDPANQFVPVDG